MKRNENKEKAIKLLAAFDTLLDAKDPYDKKFEEADEFVNDLASDYFETANPAIDQQVEYYADLWMTVVYQALEEMEEDDNKDKTGVCLRVKQERIRNALKWDLAHGEFD